MCLFSDKLVISGPDSVEAEVEVFSAKISILAHKRTCQEARL